MKEKNVSVTVTVLKIVASALTSLVFEHIDLNLAPLSFFASEIPEAMPLLGGMFEKFAENVNM